MQTVENDKNILEFPGLVTCFTKLSNQRNNVVEEGGSKIAIYCLLHFTFLIC